MYRRYKERFGTAGVVLGVIALILAIGGSAIAASGLNGKQKKQVKAIAKSFQGTGPAGAQGAAGAPGANGKDGAVGTNGTNGTNGKSVAVANYSGPECPGSEEGATVEVAGEPSTKKYVCDGEEGAQGIEGDPWTDLGTLPPGETEAGVWTVGRIPAEGSQAWISISFNVPLAADLSVDKAHFINGDGKEVFLNPSTFEFEELTSHPSCPGTAIDPAAVAGHLCLYTSEEVGIKTGSPAEYGIFGGDEGGFSSFHNAETGFLTSFGVSKAGAAIVVTAKNNLAYARGTWAVTG